MRRPADVCVSACGQRIAMSPLLQMSRLLFVLKYTLVIFLFSHVYFLICRKLLVIQTPAGYFDSTAVPDKGSGPLFLHLKAVSLGMQRLFHFLEHYWFFFLLVYHNHGLQRLHFYNEMLRRAKAAKDALLTEPRGTTVFKNSPKTIVISFNNVEIFLSTNRKAQISS